MVHARLTGLCESKIQTTVASHRGYRVPDDNMHLALHAGKALYNNQNLSPTFTGDDTGDNISTLNDYFSELTGLHWFWKMEPHHIEDLHTIANISAP